MLPRPVQRQLEAYQDALSVFSEIRDPRVLRALGPSGLRGLILQRGKQGTPAQMPASHAAHFDWQYSDDMPEMRVLYERAKANQWNGADLPWHISVDPLNPEVPVLPKSFVDFEGLRVRGIHLTPAEEMRFLHSLSAWMLSQFLHGEQGALFAAAQVTESVQFFDGKLYGATQVMDEGRHVEVFHRYIDEKMGRLYQINDNLFTIIDSLMTDSRWDMKFLGMQIMVEGLALGAFSMMHKLTKEPLLRELLRRVIHDEARHVSYGVHALKHVYTREFSENERREREDWAFEVALLMRNRFLVHELYESDFQQMMTRRQWNEMVDRSPGMRAFRTTMFSRLVPNLREIGLLTDRILPHYKRVGLAQYMNGRSATQIEAEELVR